VKVAGAWREMEMHRAPAPSGAFLRLGSRRAGHACCCALGQPCAKPTLNVMYSSTHPSIQNFRTDDSSFKIYTKIQGILGLQPSLFYVYDRRFHLNVMSSTKSASN
jgi:hypothetical protein